MRHHLVSCSMCGFRFDPAEALACQACPLHHGCTLVRCPACGFEMAQVEGSTLARLADNWLHSRPQRWRRSRRRHRQGGGTTLADVPPGQSARVLGFTPGLAPERWMHLQAYGLTPGCMVRVTQHSPVTIVQVEHIELALEGDLARYVRVAGV
jgi:Fe2+ transport system protein FeoA